MLLTLAKVLLICSAIQSLNNSHLAFGFSVKIKRETNYTLQFNQYPIHTNCKSSCLGHCPNQQHSEFMSTKHSIPFSNYNYKDFILAKVIAVDWNELFYSGREFGLFYGTSTGGVETARIYREECRSDNCEEKTIISNGSHHTV